MIKEQKAPRDWKTWADFANCYDLVLFNEAPNLVHKDNNSYFEGVIYEWLETHTCDLEDGEECTCEPYQWYAIAVPEYEMKFLNEYFELDIFYSDILGLHLLPVYHYGTAWSHISLTAVKSFE
jgi:hypothetical protein